MTAKIFPSARTRYIGSKTRVVEQLLSIIGSPRPGETAFFDGFCGTGVVSEVAAAHGWPIHLNDSLRSATVMSAARLIGRDTARFTNLNGYASAIAELNATGQDFGFFWREYSPASQAHLGFERRYFTSENAARIDSVRERIRTWHQSGAISEWEHTLLLADLLAAASAVANISGTFGCFLKDWSPSSIRPLEIRPRLLPETSATFRVSLGDVRHARTAPSDVAYFDPPYTKRQYAAYYHILETLAFEDEPTVGGVTGLRPWRDKASDFSYKTRALGAIRDLIAQARGARIFLSYSSEGHVEPDALAASLEPLGKVTFHSLASIGRYRPNRRASTAASRVTEFLVEVKKPCEPGSAQS